MFDKLSNSLKKDFTTMTLVLIPVAIAINIVIGQIVFVLKLPVFLDSIGTVLVGALAGPWAGALTGALTNIVWGLLINPDLLPWTPVAMVIGAVAGICSILGLFKSWWKVVISGLIIASQPPSRAHRLRSCLGASQPAVRPLSQLSCSKPGVT
jgi:energy-coupling factor transport system substrate-specific component